MKKTFHLLLVFFLFSFFFFLFSCHCKKKATSDTISSTEAKRDFEKEGYVKATVVYYELDACKYILQLVSDLNGPDVLKQLEPANLKEEFKKDRIAVWIKYTLKKGGVSACMAGPMVDLTDIHLRK